MFDWPARMNTFSGFGASAAVSEVEARNRATMPSECFTAVLSTGRSGPMPGPALVLRPGRRPGDGCSDRRSEKRINHEIHEIHERKTNTTTTRRLRLLLVLLSSFVCFVYFVVETLPGTLSR